MTTTEETLSQLLAKMATLEESLKLQNSSSPTQSIDGILHFNEKEISKMPKTFRKEFRARGCIAHVRKRMDGRYNCSYEIRYHRNGYAISASATTLDEAKKRFIEKLETAVPKEKDIALVVPTKFGEFADYWLKNFYKRKVKENTFTHYTKMYERHIQGKFENRAIKEINPIMIQAYLDSFADRPRLQEDIHSMLNQIFSCAVKHGLIKLNPLGMVFHKKHQRTHGKAISKDDEKKLLEAYANTPYQIGFAIALYTGLRPNEYNTVEIDDKFIKAINSKRKGGKVEYKRIAISPMLAPYLNGNTRLNMPTQSMLLKRLKKILPTHTLYDMRTTFQTRCTECGISETVIGLFMGNSIGALKEAYTDLSDEYLLKESEKLRY